MQLIKFTKEQIEILNKSQKSIDREWTPEQKAIFNDPVLRSQKTYTELMKIVSDLSPQQETITEDKTFMAQIFYNNYNQIEIQLIEVILPQNRAA